MTAPERLHSAFRVLTEGAPAVNAELALLARAVWTTGEHDRECPETALPTAGELATFMQTGCPTETLAKADAQARTAFDDESVRWDAEGGMLGLIAADTEGAERWMAPDLLLERLPRAPSPLKSLAPIVAAWQLWRTAEPFRPRLRASLPRFERTSPNEARLLEAASIRAQPGQLELPFDGASDPIDYCPSWLLDAYERASLDRHITRGLAWSFTIAIGAVAHTPLARRSTNGTDVPLVVDDPIGWLHGGEDWARLPDEERLSRSVPWGHRTRDWAKLDQAFEELPRYRVEVPGPNGVPYRFPMALGFGLPKHYEHGAPVIFKTFLPPPSSARGIRIDWPTFLRYRTSAPLTRAYLSTAAFMDLSARNGEPISRLIHPPILGKDGKALRGPSGKVKRDKTAALVPNKATKFVQRLPDTFIAKFMGLADTREGRRSARKAISRLHNDGVIEAELERGQWRFFARHRLHAGSP